MLKDLVKVIQYESYTYKDPITEFLQCLYVNFDFDGAQQKLRECETVSVLVKVWAIKMFFLFCLALPVINNFIASLRAQNCDQYSHICDLIFPSVP